MSGKTAVMRFDMFDALGMCKSNPISTLESKCTLF